jgi:predicted AlkP superfamily phosphohydrolase/phosphomutase
VGRVLDALDSRTALLLVSDHGFTDFGTCFDLNAWLVEEGLMKLTADPAGLEEDETALYRLVDWSRTVAYGCGFSSLYLNLKGREGNGVVDPSEKADLAAKIAERIAAYRDPATGERPVARIDRREDIYSGPQLEEAPDMVIGTRPGYRMGWRTPIGGVGPTVLSPNHRHWDGDHILAPDYVPGTILSNAPLKVERATVLNVAPTVLSLLGLPASEDMDGAALELTEAPEGSRQA